MNTVLQSLVVQGRPTPFGFPFVNDLLQVLLRKLRAFELVLDNFLNLGIVVIQLVFSKLVSVHVTGQRGILDRRI